jgi:transcriptional regulator
MYTPDAFRIDDPATLQAFIERHPLGTLVAMAGGEFIVNHIPMIWRPGVLQGHVARANAVWELPPHTPVVVIFHGAEHYLSPSMYPEGSKNLPTWNYSVVHVHGEICFRDSSSEALSNVNALARQYEKTRTPPWTVADAPADYVVQLSGRIVAFEISISRMIGKFKANQQRPDPERAFVAQALAREGVSPSDIAELIRDKR